MSDLAKDIWDLAVGMNKIQVGMAKQEISQIERIDIIEQENAYKEHTKIISNDNGRTEGEVRE